MTKANYTKPAVLIVVPAIAVEGISKVVLMQLQALLEKGYPVKLIVLSNVDTDALKAFAPNLSREQVIELHQQDSYLSVNALKGAFSTATRVRKVIADFRPEVIFAHAPFAHFILRLVMLFSGRSHIRLIQYFHFPQYEEFPLHSFKRRSINLLNRWLARQFDFGHVSVSEAVKRNISEHLISLKNHQVIYNAIGETNRITSSQNSRSDSYSIVIPGRLEDIKGQLWFLKVFKEFLGRITDRSIKLIIVGGGSKYNQIQDLIHALKIQEFVEITGPLPNNMVLGYMQQADLVVLPSFIEGLPMVLLEALQQGAIVLASDIGPHKEVLSSEDLGVLFKVGNAEDCLEKLLFIYNNKDRKIVDQNAIDTLFASKFSFKKHMQQLISVIENAR